MKRFISLTITLLCLCVTQVHAYDFHYQYYGYDYNYNIFYNKLTPTTVEVTYGSTSYNSYSGAITIPSTVTYNDIIYNVTGIAKNAFKKCTNLTSVTIGDRVTSIEEYAFDGCSRLKSVTIPASVTSIASYAFKNCTGLTSVSVASGNTVYDSRNNCNAIIETETNTLIVGCKNTVIPSSVTSIGEAAFYNCSALTSIDLPAGLTSIGSNAFALCSQLASLTIPNSVTSIENDAFYACSGLMSLSLGNSVTSIGSNAFMYCSGLTSLTIPNSVTSIENSSFDGCSALKSVIVERETPPTLGTSVFSNISSTCRLFVPTSDAVNNYQSWTQYFGGGIETFVCATGITLNNDQPLLLSVGETATLTATVTPADVFDGSVTWTSSNETVATVNSEGVVTAVGEGSAAIFATTNDGTNLTATCMVTVNASVLADGIILSNESLLLTTVGETATLTATVTPSDATNKSVIWSSSDETVATVNSEGVVTAVGEGTATITATTNDGTNLSATCIVTVEIPSVIVGTIDWVAADQGYENTEAVASIDFGSGITATLDKGTNSNGPKYYNTGMALRMYNGNTMTITADGVMITEIAFTFASGEGTNAITVDTGDYASGVWQGCASSVTFTIDGTTGHRRIQSISIIYGDGAGVVVKRPTISPKAGTYTEPIDVTITAETGLKVLYSMDNTTYNYYYSPIHLTESAKVYAIAEDASGNKSSAVSATYTILSGIEGSGTATNPYTASDANKLCLGGAIPADRVYVQGKISKIESIDVYTGATMGAGAYGCATYYISKDGTETDQFEIYRGYSLNGEKFTSADEIKVGDFVIVYGKLKLVNTTPEMDAGSSIFKLNDEGGTVIEPEHYATIAAAKEGATDTKTEAYLTLNNVTVTYVDGTNYYITDGSDGFLLYGTIPGLEPQAGDVLSGTVKGDLYTYHGLPEMTPATAGTEVTKTGTTEVVPEAVEMGDVLADGLAYSSKLVKLTDVMFGAAELTTEEGGKHGQVTIMSMGEEALLFDQFDQAKGLTFDTEAEDYEFSAIVCLRDGVIQFYPTNKAELERDTPTPEYPTYTTIYDIRYAATAEKVVSIFRESNLLVTYVNSKSIYVEEIDATDTARGFLLFADVAVKDVKAGDRITVDIKGELYLYHGLPELSYKVADATITVESEGNEVEPTLDNLWLINENAFDFSSMLITFNHPVKFTAATLTNKSVTFTGDIEGETFEGTLYDQFGVLTDIEFDTEKEYEGQTFLVSVRDEVVQFYPVNRSEFVTEVYVFDGEGTEESPYSVADVRYLYLNSQAPAEKVWVEGTIIGCVNGSFKEEKFANEEGDENLVASNIVLADAGAHGVGPRKDVAGYDLSKCIPVELKANTVFREKLNLVDNIGNVGKEILVNGNIMHYFSVSGVKNLDDAIIDGVSLDVDPDTDISQLSNVVYMDCTEAIVGTEQTLSIKMKNSDAIQTVQFDLYLPDGVEVVLDEDDYELIELSLERTTARKMDQFSVARTSNGAYRVLINSSRGNTFDGNDGEIATARVKLADDMAAGDYPLIFRDIVLVNTSSVGYRTPYVKSTWSIADYLPGDVNNDKFVDAIDLNAITNYILEHRTFPFTFNVKAGDINGDNLIDAIDLNAVTNMILHDAQEAQDGAKPRAVMVGIIDNE